MLSVGMVGSDDGSIRSRARQALTVASVNYSEQRVATTLVLCLID